GGTPRRGDGGEGELLDIKYVLGEGGQARRKFWGNQIVVGTTQGQKDMADAYTRMRGKILQSARGIKDGDQSPQARAAYMADLKDFDGLMFIARIGVEKGGPNKKIP